MSNAIVGGNSSMMRMPFSGSGIGVAILVLVVVVIMSSIPLVLRIISRSTKKYPPAVGLSAIVGNLLMHKESRPHCIFTRWAKTYGPIYSLRTGLHGGVVVLNSSKSAKEAMVDRHSSITTKKLTTALQMLSLDKTMVALSDYGRDHRLLKKLMVTHLLGSAPQKRNRCMRAEMLQRIIDSMYSQLKINYSSVGTIMNMSKIILDQLFPFALKQVIGRDIESVYVEEMGTVVSQQQIYELVVGDPAKGALEINWRDFIPYVSRWLPNRKLERKLKDVIWRRSAIVKALIQQQRELLLRGKEASGYLDMLLKEGQQLEDKQLETAIWEPIIESSITTHVALEWALFELAKNPKCQDRVHKELEEVCGDQIVTEDDLRKLPYLKAIFHETVRKYPPLPLIPLRYVHEDVELAGYHVPAGWQILVNIYGANNYQGEWENPEMWKPERHLEVKEETKIGADDEAADLQRSGMTFGAGKRLCAGWMQGMVIACMTIARIVQNFQWELPVGHDEEDVETITNTGTHRLRPLLAVLNPRTKSN